MNFFVKLDEYSYAIVINGKTSQTVIVIYIVAKNRQNLLPISL